MHCQLRLLEINQEPIFPNTFKFEFPSGISGLILLIDFRIEDLIL